MMYNLKNIIMVRNMRKKNARFGSNMNDINDIGFAILSYEDEKTIGSFKYCNKVACKLLGVMEDRIIGQSVANIMPEQVRTHHDFFIKRFQIDGMPRIFGRVRNFFVKDFNEHVIPVQFYMNVYYSTQFGYSLILHLDPIENVEYFGSHSGSALSVKHCMFFLCDNQNLILNYSENVSNLLNLTGKERKEQEEILGRKLKMGDIIKAFHKIESQVDTGLTYLPNTLLKLKSFKPNKE